MPAQPPPQRRRISRQAKSSVQEEDDTSSARQSSLGSARAPSASRSSRDGASRTSSRLRLFVRPPPGTREDDASSARHSSQGSVPQPPPSRSSQGSEARAYAQAQGSQAYRRVYEDGDVSLSRLSLQDGSSSTGAYSQPANYKDAGKKSRAGHGHVSYSFSFLFSTFIRPRERIYLGRRSC